MDEVNVIIDDKSGLIYKEEFSLNVRAEGLDEESDTNKFEFEVVFKDTILEFQGVSFNGCFGTANDRVVTMNGNIVTVTFQSLKLVGNVKLVNLDFKYISTEYQQDVVELDEFEFHSTNPNVEYDVTITGGAVSGEQ